MRAYAQTYAQTYARALAHTHTYLGALTSMQTYARAHAHTRTRAYTHISRSFDLDALVIGPARGTGYRV